MRTISTAMETLLMGYHFFLADLFTFTLADGSVFRWTSGDGDIAWLPLGSESEADAVIWTVNPVRIEREDITQAAGVSVDDCKVILHCDKDSLINSIRVPHFARIGGFDNARVKIELAVMPSYGDTAAGLIHLFEGNVTDMDIDGSQVAFTVSSDNILLDAQIPREVYQPSCLHSLYDNRCQVDRSGYAEYCTVSSAVGDGRIWFSSGNGIGFFTLGKITFTSGQNNGLSRTVKYHSNDLGVAVIIPTEPFPFVPATGDTFVAVAGCDKLRATCIAKFNNAANFLAFEYMPVPETSV